MQRLAEQVCVGGGRLRAGCADRLRKHVPDPISCGVRSRIEHPADHPVEDEQTRVAIAEGIVSESPAPEAARARSATTLVPRAQIGQPRSTEIATRYIRRGGTEHVSQPSKSPWTVHKHRETFSRPALSPPRPQRGDPLVRNPLQTSA